jgi:hypothetical protein
MRSTHDHGGQERLSERCVCNARSPFCAHDFRLSFAPDEKVTRLVADATIRM